MIRGGGFGEMALELRAHTALERTQISFPAPMLDSSQLPVTSTSGYLTPSSGFCRHPHSCAHPHICNLKNKGCGDDTVAKSTYCSCRRAECGSQHHKVAHHCLGRHTLLCMYSQMNTHTHTI